MGFLKRRTIFIVIVLLLIAIQLFSLSVEKREKQTPAARFVLTLPASASQA